MPLTQLDVTALLQKMAEMEMAHKVMAESYRDSENGSAYHQSRAEGWEHARQMVKDYLR